MDNKYILCPNCVKLKLPHPRILGRLLSGDILIFPSTCINIDNINTGEPIEIFCDKCKLYTTLLRCDSRITT